MTGLDVTALRLRPKYSLEIECGGAECSRYEPQWSCYDMIVTEGDSLIELLENAEVSIMDQDGGELGSAAADAEWMAKLIAARYMTVSGGE